MTTAARTRTDSGLAVPDSAGDAARGWYFYGITRRGPLAPVLAAADGEHELDAGPPPIPSDAPLQALEFSELAAVVRPVRLSDFSVGALRERLHDASALEATVRSHNRVVEAIHERQAILPAKFGMVYARPEHVISGLRPAHDTLLHHLRRLEGCDEWAVHLYADRVVARERVFTGDPAIRRLREACAAARPGRAFFLEHQLRDELDAATDQALSAVADRAFDRIAGCAVAGEVSPVGPAADLAGELEILRASFLVSRDRAERFKEEVDSTADGSEGLRCEFSGPWPPYTFALPHDEEAW